MTIVNMVGGSGGGEFKDVTLTTPYILLKGPVSETRNSGSYTYDRTPGTYNSSYKYAESKVDDITMTYFKRISSSTTNSKNPSDTSYLYCLEVKADDLFYKGSGNNWFSYASGDWFDWTGVNSVLTKWSVYDHITPDLGPGDYYIQTGVQMVYNGSRTISTDRLTTLPYSVASTNCPFKFVFHINRTENDVSIKVKPIYSSGADIRTTSYRSDKLYYDNMALAFIPQLISTSPL